MNILIDTSVWSLVFRRKNHEPHYAQIVSHLILEGRAKIMGPIRQELLSGVEDRKQFVLLKQKLQAFSDIPLSRVHYETAAELYNQCRKKGVQGSHIDFLICAVAKIEELLIFTTDQDFVHYSNIVGLKLYQSPKLSH